jgi:hypothetical protein
MFIFKGLHILPNFKLFAAEAQNIGKNKQQKNNSDKK